MYFIIQVAVGHNYINTRIKTQNITVSDNFNVYELFCFVIYRCLVQYMSERLESFLINWGKVQLKR
jgi:hypothetical protein